MLWTGRNPPTAPFPLGALLPAAALTQGGANAEASVLSCAKLLVSLPGPTAEALPALPNKEAGCPPPPATPARSPDKQLGSVRLPASFCALAIPLAFAGLVVVLVSVIVIARPMPVAVALVFALELELELVLVFGASARC